MSVCTTRKEIASKVEIWKREGHIIGFVPTMGSLHEGHLALLRASKERGYKTVLSIYVNPTQFNEASDFEKYPRDLGQDIALVGNLADAVFAPSDSEMYTEKPLLSFDFGSIERVMEGRFRPGHFNGVGIVVSKLFNMVQPDVAFFGQKDFQQCAVVECLVQDLGFPIEIIRHPIIREADGLAMSSRNRRLTEDQRKVASYLFATLKFIKNELYAGCLAEIALEKGKRHLEKSPLFRLDYLEIADTKTLQPITGQIKGGAVICIAAFLGDVRLIDNLLVNTSQF